MVEEERRKEGDDIITAIYNIQIILTSLERRRKIFVATIRIPIMAGLQWVGRLGTS